jgi:lysophospholipase L1-like esterase
VVYRKALTLLLVSAAIVALVLGINLTSADTSQTAAGGRGPGGDGDTACTPGWAPAWNASPMMASGGRVVDRPEVGGRTLRMIVRPRLSGPEVRLVLSNRYGAEPLDLRSVTVGLVAGGASLAAAPVPVTFDQLSSAQVPARGTVISDPVELPVTGDSTLAVSMYLPRDVATVSEHPWAMTTSFISDPGDHAAAVDGVAFTHSINSWLVLTGVDVRTAKPTNAVMVMGDSITDGMGSSPDADRRFTDDLGDKLLALGGGREMDVLNGGIAGNQLLTDRIGESTLSRLTWEAAGRPGVTDVVLHVGTNDIAFGAAPADVIAGMKTFTQRAHEANLRVFLTTITPAATGAHGTKRAAAGRAEVNKWIRAHGREFADGVFDFAAAVTDVSNPTRLVTGFDAGDGIHLSDVGYRALAGAVDLYTLTGSRCLD